MAISSDGRIYVSDSNNFRVQVCEDGEMLELFGSSDTSNPKSVLNSLVRGIAVDDDDLIWVVDTLGNNVGVFNEEGRPIYFLGSMEVDEAGMSFPNGISIDKERLYVTDRGNKRVLVFSR